MDNNNEVVHLGDHAEILMNGVLPKKLWSFPIKQTKHDIEDAVDERTTQGTKDPLERQIDTLNAR